MGMIYFLGSLLSLIFHLPHSTCQDFLIKADAICDNLHDPKVCAEPGGHYYSLSNGTWNSSTAHNIESLAYLNGYLRSYTCPLAIGVDSDRCNNECCYCELEFPVPHHSISNRLLMPKDISCENRLRQKFGASGSPTWHQTEPEIFRCQFDTGPVRLPFLCVLLDNLKRVEETFSNVNLMSTDEYHEMLRSRRSTSSWRNASTRANKFLGRTTEKSNQICMDGLEKLNEVREHEWNGIIFNIHTSSLAPGPCDSSDLMDFVEVASNPVKNVTFKFSGLTQCLSKYRRWRWNMYPPCQYTIDTSNFSSCFDLRVAIKITSQIVYHYLSSDDEGELEEDSWNNLFANEIANDTDSSESEGSPLECEMVPGHLTITEVWGDGRCIIKYLSFDNILGFVSVSEEFVLTASADQKVVTEKDYTSLSKFWVNFYFGECLYRECWRDLWSILPHDLLIQNSTTLTGDPIYSGSRYFLLLFLLFFFLIVRSCLINREYEVEIQ